MQTHHEQLGFTLKMLDTINMINQNNGKKEKNI